MRPDFLNFKVDHMTLLLNPKMYNVSYLVFRIVFGCEPAHMIYEKRKTWDKKEGEKSLTYAMQIGDRPEAVRELDTVMIAIVQPSEPLSQPSHVRAMLDQHMSAAHWQHIALRTSDLLAFHRHAEDRAVNFITPVLKDESEDVIQVFTGEWFCPNTLPSGMFFEFLQRNPSRELLAKLSERNRESWFNDQTFLGLYGEKESEYQRGQVTPFIDHELFLDIHTLVKNKNLWEISESDVAAAESKMLNYARRRNRV